MTRKITRRSFSALAVGVPGVALLSACTGNGQPPPSPTANAAITQLQTGGGAASAAPSANAAAANQPTVTLKTTNDLKFVPNEFSIPPNTAITVTLDDSAGALPHNFACTDHNQTAGLPNLNVSFDVAPGQTASGTVNAPQAGDYYFYCDVPGHESAGMFGTMHVDPSAQLPAAGGGAGTPAAGGTPATGGQPAGIAAPAGNTAVTLKTTNDLKFDPAEFTISANTPVTVTLDDSAGALPHNISIDDHKQNPGLPNLKVSIDVAPGQTAKGTVNAPQPGDYYFYCNVPGHEAAGMFGTMHVK